MALIWRFDEVPERPPDGADPLIWRLAYGLRGDHLPEDPEGRCAVCREPAPCRLLGVALQGLVLAAARGERYAALTRLEPSEEDGDTLT